MPFVWRGDLLFSYFEEVIYTPKTFHFPRSIVSSNRSCGIDMSTNTPLLRTLRNETLGNLFNSYEEKFY